MKGVCRVKKQSLYKKTSKLHTSSFKKKQRDKKKMLRTINYNEQDIQIDSKTHEEAIKQIYKPTQKKKGKIGDYQ